MCRQVAPVADANFALTIRQGDQEHSGSLSDSQLPGGLLGAKFASTLAVSMYAVRRSIAPASEQ